MDYLTIKALHIIFVTSWFAGLFYLPRLLVYHREAADLPAAEAAVLVPALVKYQKLLYNAIMMPAMVMVLLTGGWLLYSNEAFWAEPWMRLKLAFVAGVLGYHFYCKRLMGNMAAGRYKLSSLQLRLWNEVATILLFAVVFLVVLKNTISWLWALLGLVLFSVLIMLAVRMVKTLRNR
jgi:protoporphyrinogen IX oxidase